MAGRAAENETADGGGADEGRLRVLPIPFIDDRALAEAVVCRHPSAAREVWSRFSSLVRGLLRRTLGPNHEVEDEVQEVFLRFFEEAPKLRDRAKLRSFIVGITMRVARGQLRKRRAGRWLRLTQSGELPSVAVAGGDVDARAALAHLHQLLDRIDSRARVLFVLRHVEKLELTDIAEIMDCSLATVKRHIRKASGRIIKLAEREPALVEYLACGSSESEREAAL